MAYCVWADVVNVFPEASDIEATGADQTAIIAAATELTDALLSPFMRTPVQQDGGAYPTLIVEICALLAADHTAWRVLADDAEVREVEYDGTIYTLTLYGVRALGYIRALANRQAALDADVTPPEVKTPLVEVSFTTTNGTFTARFADGLFTRNAKSTYKFTISSSGGTVAGEDLTFTVKRDNDEDVYEASAPLAITSSDWYAIEYGLQIRCVDAASSPAWTQNETITVTCESMESDVKSGGLRSVEVNLG